MPPADLLALGGHVDRRDAGRARIRSVVDGRAHPTGVAGARGFGLEDDPLDLDAVLAVGLVEVDPDRLLARGRHVLADMVRADRQLAVAAVDEHREPDRLRPPEVHEGVHRGADRPAGVQDVVDEDDRAPVDPRRQLRALDDRLLGDQREVIAVERDVERTDRHLDAFVFQDGRRRSAGRAGRRGAGSR